MKIVTVAPYYHPKIGGLENYARQLNYALHDQEHCEVVVVTANHAGRASVIDTVDGLTVYRLGTWFRFSNTPINPLWPFMIRRIIKHEEPDVILAHTPVPSMAEAASLASGKVPFVVMYHAATLSKGDEHPFFNLVARAYALYERRMLARATRVVAISEYVRGQFPAMVIHKTEVLPNSVWKHALRPRRQPTHAPFMFIGQLDRSHAWKGLDDIIAALLIYRQQHGTDATLQIIGDGNYRRHYVQMVQAAGLSGAVTFLGPIQGAERDNALAKAAALICYPTTANDALPTVLIEAWALQVPTISAAIGPLPSLVSQGKYGYLVEAHNPSKLAEALHHVLTTSTRKRSGLARAAAEQVQREYTWEKQASHCIRILESLS